MMVDVSVETPTASREVAFRNTKLLKEFGDKNPRVRKAFQGLKAWFQNMRAFKAGQQGSYPDVPAVLHRAGVLQ